VSLATNFAINRDNFLAMVREVGGFGANQRFLA
jgi:hypothetical protein